MRCAAILLTVALTSPALAQNGDCRNGEYAQYRDRAKTEDGLALMARDYCTNAVLNQGKTLPRCIEGNAKMVDAAAAEGVGPQFQAMTSGMPACIENANRLRSRGLIP